MDKTTRIAKSMTAKSNRATTRHGITSNRYINPESISIALSNKYRVEKDEEQDLWYELKKKTRYDFPAACNNRLDAIVFK